VHRLFDIGLSAYMYYTNKSGSSELVALGPTSVQIARISSYLSPAVIDPYFVGNHPRCVDWHSKRLVPEAPRRQHLSLGLGQGFEKGLFNLHGRQDFVDSIVMSFELGIVLVLVDDLIVVLYTIIDFIYFITIVRRKTTKYYQIITF